jgi:hypothetical protein
MLRIEQGILQTYTGPRTCNVIQVPDNYLLTDVRVPHTLFNQGKPLKGSIVLVVATDDYKSFLLTSLRDPQGFLENGVGIRGSTDDTENFLQAGEVFFEAAGTQNPKDSFSGTGGTFFLGNDGTVALKSGKQKEFLILGGEDTDDDGEVILTGDNGFFESNINHLTSTRSSYKFDEDNNIEIGNFRTTVPSTGSITEIPIGHITIDAMGTITIESDNVIGLSQSLITLQPSGFLVLNSVGQITADSSLINLNSGTFGVARLNDSTVANPTTDPLYWQFWTTQNAIFTALPPATDPGSTTALANALKAALITLTAMYPQSITGRISTASTTVKAGG